MIFSGSSTGSSSIPHSFSVDEIQKMRVKLKVSKSYPENQLLRPDNAEEVDNSSSGVSSDQEIMITNNAASQLSNSDKTVSSYANSTALQQHRHNPTSAQQPSSIDLNPGNQLKTLKKIPPPVDCSACNALDIDEDDSPSPPPKNFQRHNSLTRKQAANIAMNRAMQTRPAVSLLKLPPPIEDETDSNNLVARSGAERHCILDIGHTRGGLMDRHQRAAENIVLAPPPQFCDCTNNGHNVATATTQSAPPASGGRTIRSVRIVGAVPKVNQPPS